MTTKQRAKVKKSLEREVAHAVKRLDPPAVAKVFEEVLAEEQVPAGRKPGQEIHGTKTPWTDADLVRIHGICEFTPEETTPVTVNGVRYQLVSGVSMVVPKIVRDVYTQSRRERAAAGKSLPKESGFTTVVDLGVGALGPEIVTKVA